MKKKILVCLITIALIFQLVPFSVYSAELPCYEIENKTVELNDEFSVDVSIANNPGIVSLRFSIVFDSSFLELLSVSDAKLLNGYTTPSSVIASPYKLRWADSYTTENNEANGKVATLTFKALKAGSTEIQIQHVESRNVTGSKISFVGAKSNVLINHAQEQSTTSDYTEEHTSTGPTEPPTATEPTEAHTTAKPTVAPTTAKPTVAPTTAKPTVAPTTAKPTVAPTTAKPTVAPTTAKPTVAPTTVKPTVAPTTAKPTIAPTTVEPTTATPTTQPHPEKKSARLVVQCNYDDENCVWLAWTWKNGEEGHWVQAKNGVYEGLDENVLFALLIDDFDEPDWEYSIDQTIDLVTENGRIFVINRRLDGVYNNVASPLTGIWVDEVPNPQSRVRIGDVNGSGVVDITDVTMNQMIAAECFSPTQLQSEAGDVNGDGKIDITDATMIQLYIAEMITELPAEKKFNELTVEVNSNFGNATQTFNKDTNQITVTFWINSTEKMVNCQWQLLYDNEKLIYDRTKGINGNDAQRSDLVFRAAPNRTYQGMGTTIVNPNPTGKDRIIGFTSDWRNPYSLTDKGKAIPFISVTFKVADDAYGEAYVDLLIDVLSIEDDTSSGSSRLIENCDVVNPDIAFIPSNDAVTVTEGSFRDRNSDDHLVLSDNNIDNFNAWEHVNENVVLSEVSLREDEYAEGAAVKFGTYLFHADSDETDLKQLIGKKINAKGLIVTQRTEIGKDPDHLDQTYEIELQISDVEVLGDAAESMSYIVVDNEFDNNFLVGQLYQFDIAWLESQNDAFDVLNYNTDGSILCQYNYSVYSMYTFDYEKMLRQYQGKQLFCMGVCRGTEEEKYIDITFIEVK